MARHDLERPAPPLLQYNADGLIASCSASVFEGRGWKTSSVFPGLFDFGTWPRARTRHRFAPGDGPVGVALVPTLVLVVLWRVAALSWQITRTI